MDTYKWREAVDTYKWKCDEARSAPVVNFSTDTCSTPMARQAGMAACLRSEMLKEERRSTVASERALEPGALSSWRLSSCAVSGSANLRLAAQVVPGITPLSRKG